MSLHFPCPLAFPFGLADEADVDLRGGDFFLFADFAGCLSTMSRSDICSCRIGPWVSMVNPSWVIGFRRPSLISPILMDWSGPWKVSQTRLNIWHWHWQFGRGCEQVMKQSKQVSTFGELSVMPLR
jgi:hypothetical protein